jgi:hypothetical protein
MFAAIAIRREEKPEVDRVRLGHSLRWFGVREWFGDEF